MSDSEGLQLNYKEVIFENIIALAPEEKTIQNTTNKYYEIPLKYNYGTVEKPMINEFFIEGPELSSPGGVANYPQNGKDSWGIMAVLPVSKDQIIKEFADCIAKVYVTAGIHLSKVQGKVGIPEFDVERPSATGFKNPVYYSRDKTTGKIIQGRDPSLFIKLINFGKGAFQTKTLFTQIDVEKSIDWELVQSVEMKFIPLLHVEKIYIGGGKASLQMKMKSAIVTSVRPINSSSSQTKTAKKLIEENPNKELTLKEQIAALTALRQDVLEKKMSSATISDPTGGQKGKEKGSPKEQRNEASGSGGPKITQDPMALDTKAFLASLHKTEQ